MRAFAFAFAFAFVFSFVSATIILIFKFVLRLLVCLTDIVDGHSCSVMLVLAQQHNHMHLRLDSKAGMVRRKIAF
jgi:hypothetical protein